MTGIPEELNPDRMVLTKKDVIDFLKSIKKRWEKNKKANALYIVGLDGIIVMTTITPEGTVNKFWMEVLRFFNYMLYRNAMAQAKQNGESWQDLLSQAKSYMEEEI